MCANQRLRNGPVAQYSGRVMMSLYLPIAELPVNILLLLTLGGVAGMLAGLFGIGGGFLMTPLLIFIGVPPPVAVATSTNQIVAATFSGFLAHWHQHNVDFKMGGMLLLGGLGGSSLGVWLFKLLKESGQIDLTISLIYVVFLGTIGTLMAIESTRTLLRLKSGGAVAPPQPPRWVSSVKWPLMTEFPVSELRVSALVPIAIGAVAGVLVSLMGIGGGFIMIPGMIYLLGMPTSKVVGTSLFQTMFITSNVTILQAVNTQTVDIVLAVVLMVGAVVGAQIGSRLSTRIPAPQVRALLAALVLLVCLRLAFGLFATPDDPFTVVLLEGGG